MVVCCPGSWTHGLDSPERGEGRWSQNLARALAESGEYDVFALSGGRPTWGQGLPCARSEGIVLLPEANVEHYIQEADVYIDSAWWDAKPAKVKAPVNLHLHFGMEDRLMQSDFGFGPDHYLCYPFAEHTLMYMSVRNPHPERTFFLPVELGALTEPRTPAAHTLLWSTRPPSGGGADNPSARKMMRAIALARKTVDFGVYWLFANSLRAAGWLEDRLHPRDTELSTEYTYGIPYHEVVRLLAKEVTVNLTVGAPSNVPNASVAGVPSLLWGEGSPGGGAWPPAREVSTRHGLTVPHNAPEEYIADTLCQLMQDPTLYVRYAKELQHLYRDNTRETCLARFANIVRAVGLG